MFAFLKTLFSGNKEHQDWKRLVPILSRINELEAWALALRPEDFPAQTKRWKQEIHDGKEIDILLPHAFALAREAARRCLGERLYDVQILGSIVLHRGAIMEMKTGEGKTLSSVPAAYLNSLAGGNLHIVTVNDYLAQRDAEWMRPVYEYLGLSVAAIQSSMGNEARIQAYKKDITYATNNELGFDYLRDNLCYDVTQKVQDGQHFCIVDEIDSILVDEARTPLIISGSAESDTRKYYEINELVSYFQEAAKDPQTGEYPEEPQGDYTVDEKGKRIFFTDQGMNRLETLLKKRNMIDQSLFEEENFEYVHFATQALRAHILYRRDTEYVVRNGKVEIVDEFTGRILHGRRYSEGLHQAIEAKERIKVLQRSKTIATITLQNYFRLYKKISGMTGTAATEAREFSKIYNMDVVVIPTHFPLIRNDENDSIYLSEKDKHEAICKEIEELHQKGTPILVGTISIEKSEVLSKMLKKRAIQHEVLNAKNHEREAHIIAEAGAAGAVTIATNMAGRGTDIKLGGSPEFRAHRKLIHHPNQDYQTVYEEQREKWYKEYQYVKSLGGLCVLGTERHESRRIDNQLRGRSGRQGDPGRSKFFVSLDDDLMRLFGRGAESIRRLMTKNLQPGESLHHSIITKSLERAQKRVEERNFEIRKHLLEFDDVLNIQRKIVYEQRDTILDEANLMKRLTTTLRNILDEVFHGYQETDEVLKDVIHHVEVTLFRRIPPDISQQKDIYSLHKKLYSWYISILEEKEKLIGKEQWNLLLRHEYLLQIDRYWQDHLDSLDSLREAVYLRSYAQKNPLVEYKLEGFKMFDQMINTIQTTIIRRLMNLKIVPENTTINTSHTTTSHQASHISTQLLGSKTSSKRIHATTQRTIKRNIEKVGRNEPCPCGSGRKYKHCHGKES